MKSWCHAKVDHHFIASMEEVLDLYQNGVGEGEVLVCVDEQPLTLHQDKYPNQPAVPGHPARQDYEYKRCGGCTLFMMFAPGRKERHIQVLEKKRMVDFARVMQWLSQQCYPDVARIHVVCDNLNTHKPGSFYKGLPVEQAAELRKKIVFHYTPKHASWLNMAEIELSAATNQCIGSRRISTQKQMLDELTVWANQRNDLGIGVDWSFTSAKARVKLKKLYDQILMS